MFDIDCRMIRLRVWSAAALMVFGSLIDTLHCLRLMILAVFQVISCSLFREKALRLAFELGLSPAFVSHNSWWRMKANGCRVDLSAAGSQEGESQRTFTGNLPKT